MQWTVEIAEFERSQRSVFSKSQDTACMLMVGWENRDYIIAAAHTNFWLYLPFSVYLNPS